MNSIHISAPAFPIHMPIPTNSPHRNPMPIPTIPNFPWRTTGARWVVTATTSALVSLVLAHWQTNVVFEKYAWLMDNDLWLIRRWLFWIMTMDDFILSLFIWCDKKNCAMHIICFWLIGNKRISFLKTPPKPRKVIPNAATRLLEQLKTFSIPFPQSSLDIPDERLILAFNAKTPYRRPKKYSDKPNKRLKYWSNAPWIFYGPYCPWQSCLCLYLTLQCFEPYHKNCGKYRHNCYVHIQSVHWARSSMGRHLVCQSDTGSTPAAPTPSSMSLFPCFLCSFFLKKNRLMGCGMKRRLEDDGLKGCGWVMGWMLMLFGLDYGCVWGWRDGGIKGMNRKSEQLFFFFEPKWFSNWLFQKCQLMSIRFVFFSNPKKIDIWQWCQLVNSKMTKFLIDIFWKDRKQCQLMSIRFVFFFKSQIILNWHLTKVNWCQLMSITGDKWPWALLGKK